MPRFGSFTSSKSLTVAKRLIKLVTAIAADTSARALATLGTFGPSTGVYIPGAVVIGTTNSEPDQSTDRFYIFSGKNSLGNEIAVYTGTMTFFYETPAAMQSQGYGFNAMLGASAFGSIPLDWNDGAPLMDLVNTNGVVTIEVIWDGMTAPFIINLTTS